MQKHDTKHEPYIKLNVCMSNVFHLPIISISNTQVI